MQTRLLTTTLLIAACGRAGAGAPAAPHDTIHPDATVSVIEPHDEEAPVSVDSDRTTVLVEHTVRIEGGLTDAQIQDIVREHFGEVSACFDESLVDGDPDVRGAIVIAFEVDASGATRNVVLELSEYGDRTTERCLLAAVDDWRFPAPKGAAASVAYPFYLASF